MSNEQRERDRHREKERWDGWWSSGLERRYSNPSFTGVLFHDTILTVSTKSSFSMFSLHKDSNSRSLAHAEVNHARRSYVYTNNGDLVKENFNIADKTAGKLEMALHVNKASANVFEPRTS